MLMSRRARRMQQHHKRGLKGGLNLVSLMDIFTILVFFLLVTSSEVEVLPNNKDVKLPESYSSTQPTENTVIVVTKTQILVQGDAVAEIADVLASKEKTIPALQAALEKIAANRIIPDATPENADGEPQPHEVTIMGDKQVEYKLLRKLLRTCATSKHNVVSLAVIQKTSLVQPAEGGQ